MPTSFAWPLAPDPAPSQTSPAIAFSASAYARQLSLLMPPGVAFNLENDANWQAVFAAISQELARIDARGVVLIDESDPRFANETIGDWETFVGIPDERITSIPVDLPSQQLAVTQKYVWRGGQSESFFIALAALCGYTVSAGSLPTPTGVEASWNNTVGGHLTAGTYGYRVTAYNDQGETIASATQAAVVGAGTSTNTAQIFIPAVPGAVGYHVYGRTSGSELFLVSILDTGASSYFVTDDGTLTPGGGLPSSNTATFPPIERFASKILRVGFRVNDRCWDAAWAYAMRLNVTAASMVALDRPTLERVVRHETHAHIIDLFTYHF